MTIEDECKRYYYVSKLLEIGKFLIRDQWKWGHFIERFLLRQFQQDLEFTTIDKEFIFKEITWINPPPKTFNLLQTRMIKILEDYKKEKNKAKNIEITVDKIFKMKFEFRLEKITYTYKFDKNRVEKLLELGNKEQIATMMMRYACLASNGQQWAHSLNFYDFFKKNYDVEIEGFASPLNSRMLLLDSYFCSLFPDTDHYFGSLCKFGEAFFENISVMCNPPFIGSVIEESVNFSIRNLEDAVKNNYKVRFIFTFPIFEDKPYFKTLNETKFLVEHFYLESGKHSYENLQGILKVFNLDTHFYVLSYGYDDSVTNMKKEVEKLFSD